ncbi:NAD-P-binding protein [Pleomassaria siparia CBS 279.74]|uniref:NAD-P-binding protein n=1 Tax=Pleomassaria siparia CBS 279.74 TaxID=1314801 RepID=A0A6G1KG12_9PLEO|nr:NAD-P-binding protein [Pleomassaria siparia CBS 279.74]
MPPIRVGFIGLSSTMSWAVFSHLPYLKSTSKYEIVALCNSSLEAAQAAIKAHRLPSTTKAYGTPEDMAADPEIDLVVCATRVDRHYSNLLPSIKAGKDVFCEWPLATNAAEAEEMVKISKDKGVKTIVGIQAHMSPALRKIKEIIASGKIGKVLSSTFHGTPLTLGATMPENYLYQNDKSIGGNLVTIYGIHSLESIQYVLGPLTSYTPLLGISFPETKVTTAAGKPTDRTSPRTSHDQFLLHGLVSSGAVLSYHLHGGPAFSNSPTAGHIWRVFGTLGEIQTTGPDSYLQIAEENIKIEVFEHASGTTEVAELGKDGFNELMMYGRNVARLYEGFADGKGVEEGVLGWGEALERHKFVDEIYKKAGV